MDDYEVFTIWFNQLGSDVYFMVDTDENLDIEYRMGIASIDYEDDALFDFKVQYVKEEYMPKDLLAYVLINET